MKKINSTLMVLVAMFCSLTLTSCPGGDDEDEKSGNCTEELMKANEDFTAKLQSLSTAPTKAKCEGMEAVAKALLDKAKECGDQNMILYAETQYNTVKTMQCSALD